MTKLRTGFENVRRINALADADTETLRIRIDTKATVSVGEYSRLAQGGILEPVTGRSFLFFGTHHKTSDFIVDGIILWWEERKGELNGLKQLVINLDNGPECNGHRS